MCSEDNGAKVKANMKANAQSLQLVGGNEGKLPITPGNNSSIPEPFLDGSKHVLHQGQLGGKHEAKYLVIQASWSQWTLFFLSTSCFIKRVYRERRGFSGWYRNFGSIASKIRFTPAQSAYNLSNGY